MRGCARNRAHVREVRKLPAGAISIGAAARGLALLRGKPNVGFDEVRRVAAPAMAHRLVLDYAARLEGWDGRRVVAALLEGIPEIERGLPQGAGGPLT